MTGKDFLFVLAFLAAWVVLNRWILPLFGVATCMSGACGAGRCPTARHQVTAGDADVEKSSDEGASRENRGDVP